MTNTDPLELVNEIDPSEATNEILVTSIEVAAVILMLPLVEVILSPITGDHAPPVVISTFPPTVRAPGGSPIKVRPLRRVRLPNTGLGRILLIATVRAPPGAAK